MSQDSTERFTHRVDAYQRYRPGYPEPLFEALVEIGGLGKGARVADLGAGTGLFCEQLLNRGLEVFAVEPNEAMRTAAETRLGNQPGFHAVAASAETTSLEAASVELVSAAQALHWFHGEAALDEMHRILVPEGQVALVWNRRDTRQPFQQAYDGMLRELLPEYNQVNHMNLTAADLEMYFVPGQMQLLQFANPQRLDFTSLLGRLRSTSYCPPENTPDYIALVNELLALFDRHAHEGQVVFDYDTHLYLGPVSR